MPSEFYAAGSDFMGDTSDTQSGKQEKSKAQMLPQNIEAEKSVLAACMLNQHAIEEIAPLLKPENFFSHTNRIIFESMINLYQRNIPVDYFNLIENLKSKNQLETVGGKEYISELHSNDMSLTN